MSLSNLKHWQWFLLSIVLGLIFAVAGTALDVDPGDTRTEVTMNQGLFEQEVRNIAAGKQIQFTDLVVHPPTGLGEWLTGHWLHPEKNGKIPGRVVNEAFKFSVNATDHMRSGIRLPNGTVTPSLLVDVDSKNPMPLRTYLEKLHEAEPKVAFSYKYAWWERHFHLFNLPTHEGPPHQIWISLRVLCFFLGTIVMFGGIFPFISNLINFGTWTQPKEEQTPDRPYRKSAPAPAAAQKGMTAADLDQLAALEAEMEKKLKPSGGSKPAAAPATAEAAPAIKPLLSGAAAAEELAAKPIPAANEDPKEFKGEFYPVAIPTVHKDDKPAT